MSLSCPPPLCEATPRSEAEAMAALAAGTTDRNADSEVDLAGVADDATGLAAAAASVPASPRGATKGRMHREKPRRAASRMRTSARLIPRISPARPTSPQTTVPGTTARSRKLDAREETIPRSMAGSLTFTPPATLMKMS